MVDSFSWQVREALELGLLDVLLASAVESLVCSNAEVEPLSSLPSARDSSGRVCFISVVSCVEDVARGDSSAVSVSLVRRLAVSTSSHLALESEFVGMTLDEVVGMSRSDSIFSPSG